MFTKFRRKYEFQNLWPIPVRHVVLFIAHCFEKGLSPKSISSYISGLNYYHKLSEFYDIAQNFIVKKILEGCHRKRRTKDKRAPLTFNVLTAVCAALQHVATNQYESCLFKALFLLAYFGLFRVSELVAPMPGTDSQLQLRDIKLSNNTYILVKLQNYKNNQRGKQVELKIPSIHHYLCPVQAISAYIAIRPSIGGPLFCHSNGLPVTRSQFSFVLKKCISKTLFLAGHYRSHSFRIGRATDLAASGVTMETIKKMGRWSSDCYKTYIRQ
jgi:site-specific recombinase XerD